MLPLLPTTLVGSYAQPDWLIDREKLRQRFPPRVRAKELWRVAPEWLEQAQDDATLLAIRDQERAGLDIVTDGEMRRESYSNRFATALDGVDIVTPGIVPSRSGRPDQVPRIVGKISRKHPVELRDTKFLRAATDYFPSRDVELLEYMELLAVFEASSRRLLPAKYANITPEELDLRMRQLRAIVGSRR